MASANLAADFEVVSGWERISGNFCEAMRTGVEVIVFASSGAACFGFLLLLRRAACGTRTIRERVRRVSQIEDAQVRRGVAVHTQISTH